MQNLICIHQFSCKFMGGRTLPKFITEKGFCKYSMNFLLRPALKRTSKSDELIRQSYDCESDLKLKQTKGVN